MYNGIMRQIRSFIAIQISQEMRLVLAGASRELAAQMPGSAVRWVKPDRMHLTLKFLGDTDVDKISAIQIAMDGAVAEHRPFSLSLGELGCFPNRSRPRVIWAGLIGDIPQLNALQGRLDAAMSQLGWRIEDRPFQAHLTLGRVKDSRKLKGIEWSADLKSAVLTVRSVDFIESQLRPGGPIYTVRHSSQLAH